MRTHEGWHHRIQLLARQGKPSAPKFLSAATNDVCLSWLHLMEQLLCSVFPKHDEAVAGDCPVISLLRSATLSATRDTTLKCLLDYPRAHLSSFRHPLCSVDLHARLFFCFQRRRRRLSALKLCPHRVLLPVGSLFRVDVWPPRTIDWTGNDVGSIDRMRHPAIFRFSCSVFVFVHAFVHACVLFEDSLASLTQG